MCGIVGVLGGHAAQRNEVRRACDALHHRGPDATGIWVDDTEGIALGHTRLSILDLSPAGHQPMVSQGDRYVIVFNGEIYNHLELRAIVAKAMPWKWRGHSDTETVLACLEAWGVERTLTSAVGMFALGVWDRLQRKLFLARDRLGEKPLYYGYVGRAFAFASELKSLAALPGFFGRIDRHALSLLMRHSYIPAPLSIYSGIEKLIPGTWLEICGDMVALQHSAKPRRYWSALACASAGAHNLFKFASDAEAVEAADGVLRRSVAGQMISDVPLGAFLSGGIDSSTVVSLMQHQSALPVRTFSIGFHADAYDEAPYAKAVARHLGTDHTELYLSPADALAVVPRLPTIYDEPFADASQIPTYLVAVLARQHVKVCLSGDGGDELFGGYNRYFLGARLWPLLRHTPVFLRKLVAKAILAKSAEFWDSCYGMVAPVIPKHLSLAIPGEQLHKSALLLDSETGVALYRRLVSHWDPKDVVLHSGDSDAVIEKDPEMQGLAETMMALDAVTYLPDDVLAKVDRAAMATSLETRVPILDHRIFEFAWRLPMRYKIRGGVGKWILRKVLDRYVPVDLIERPKAGFAVPIASWLRGPLRDWAESLLDESRLRREGFFNPAPIRRKWDEHLSGRRHWQHYLWDVLMFQAWLEHRSTPREC